MISYFDAVLGVLIVGSGLWSAHRGLVREAFALLALVLGVVFAAAGYGLVLPWLARWCGTGLVARVVAYLVMFAAAALVVVLTGWVVQKVVRVMLLGWLDRGGGFLVGAGKALLIIGMVLLFVDRFAAGHEALAEHSAVAPRLLAAARFVFRLAALAFSRFAADFS